MGRRRCSDQHMIGGIGSGQNRWGLGANWRTGVMPSCSAGSVDRITAQGPKTKDGVCRDDELEHPPLRRPRGRGKSVGRGIGLFVRDRRQSPSAPPPPPGPLDFTSPKRARPFPPVAHPERRDDRFLSENPAPSFRSIFRGRGPVNQGVNALRSRISNAL